MPFPSLAKVKKYFIYWFEGTNAIFSPGPAGLSFSNRRSHSNSEPLLTLAIRLKMGAKQPPGAASWAPPVAQPGNIVCPRAPPTADVTPAVRPGLRSRRLFYSNLGHLAWPVKRLGGYCEALCSASVPLRSALLCSASRKKEVRAFFVDFRVTTGCGDFPRGRKLCPRLCLKATVGGDCGLFRGVRENDPHTIPLSTLPVEEKAIMATCFRSYHRLW